MKPMIASRAALKRHTLICKACGLKFRSDRAHAKTCTPRCRKALQRADPLYVEARGSKSVTQPVRSSDAAQHQAFKDELEAMYKLMKSKSLSEFTEEVNRYG